MHQVVNLPDGSAFTSKINDLYICGKTGTAQNPHGEDHSTFIAFGSKEKDQDPAIAIAVYVENGTWGSVWAAPIATLMIEKYLTGKIKDQNIYDKIINANLLNKK